MAGTLLGLKADDPMDSVTHKVVSVGPTSIQVVASNPQRRILRLVNDSNAVIYISYDRPAMMNFGMRIEKDGGTITIPGCCHFSVHAIAANSGKLLLVTEGT